MKEQEHVCMLYVCACCVFLCVYVCVCMCAHVSAWCVSMLCVHVHMYMYVSPCCVCMHVCVCYLYRAAVNGSIVELLDRTRIRM